MKKKEVWKKIGATLVLTGLLLSLVACSDVQDDVQLPSESQASSLSAPVDSSSLASSEEASDDTTTSASSEYVQDDVSSSEDTSSSQVESSSETSSQDNTYKPVSNSNVPESAPVPDSYFDDACFIGNSLTQGFALYSGLTEPTYYASKGLNVNGALSDAFIEEGGQSLTLKQALQKNDFGKVYIMLGINEISWAMSDSFMNAYGEILDLIIQTQPNADIYLQGVIKVTSQKSQNDQYINNPNIDALNKGLEKLAKKKGIYYLNVNEALCDESGALAAEASSDGVHLNKQYVGYWLDYLKRHTA